MRFDVLQRSRRAAKLALVFAAMSALAACDDNAFDVASQIGASPVLPPLHQYLLPPMHIAPVVGWKDGEKPTVGPGLKIEAFATKLSTLARFSCCPTAMC